jgi:hypothetical protein
MPGVSRPADLCELDMRGSILPKKALVAQADRLHLIMGEDHGTL